MRRSVLLGGALVSATLLAAILAPGRGGLIGETMRSLIGSGRAYAFAAAPVPQAPTVGDSFLAELGLPATSVTMIGASAAEAPGEVWAYGTLGLAPALVGGQAYGEQPALLRHTDTAGWQVVPLPAGPTGEPLAYGALAGRTTASGGVVLLAGQSVIVRDPGSQPRLVPAPPSVSSPPAPTEPPVPGTPVLGTGESLFPVRASGGTTIPYAAIEDSAHTGLLIAPEGDGGDPTGIPTSVPGVLHYDGQAWTREPITGPSSEENEFTPLALACGGSASAPESSSPQNCWLLASAKTSSSGSSAKALLLFRRANTGSSGYDWEPEAISDWLLSSEGTVHPGLPAAVSSASVAALPQGAQMLTATAQGLWVDFQATINGAGESTDVSELLVATATEPKQAAVLGRWCYPVGPGCEQTLGARLPAQYRSFAWSGASETDFGARIVTGLEHRAMLELAGGSFTIEPGGGGVNGQSAGGAAFISPQQGWIADATNFINSADHEGQSQAIEVTTHPSADQLQEESVPFRRPLFAVAPAPGSTPGAAGSQALAVGDQGQIGRYVPGQGWQAESLYDSSGKAQTPTLRGVAWPVAGRAYAVGDNGAMWLWRADTGLWEPDPAKPLNFIGNLTAVAFSTSDPSLGYAVGKQGVLLAHGKTWTQVASLPANLQQANFTSVTFAGTEAIASFRLVQIDAKGRPIETGGIAVDEGSGWHVDSGAAALLATLPQAQSSVMSKVAGLADGGVVAGGPELVIERDSSGDAWRLATDPLPEAQNVSAIAAYRDPAGPVRAIVSIDLDNVLDPETNSGQYSPFSGDFPAPSGPGQPPAFLPPDPLPNSGYLLKETANGWEDMEHMALPSPAGGGPGAIDDTQVRPDPVLGLLVDPSGATGLAVGGQTGDLIGAHNEASAETAAAMRFPAGNASLNGAASAPISTIPGHVSFVVGGQAACLGACVDSADADFGPDVWLSHALQSADRIATGSPGGLRAFLYTGANGGEDVYARDLGQYAGSVPAYGPSPAGASTGSNPYYSLISQGAGGGPVMIIVLDYSSGTLGPAQQEWLVGQLAAARQQGTPAIVVGKASLGFALPDQPGSQGVSEAGDATTVSAILVQGGASAYFFDYPEANVATRVSYGAASIPAYGTGTLGYVSPPLTLATDSLGSSGFLLADVETAARNPSTNIAPVSAQVVPNVDQLALGATDGSLLRRSQVALFTGLARRPLGGRAYITGSSAQLYGPDLYDSIPYDCQGPNCPYQVPTDYTFSSSNPDIGDFVAHDPTSSNPRQVELGANQLPVHDSGSGLFCAYNSGTTTVSITTGGLSYSERVTIQGGSVEYPCGTVPLKNPPPAESAVGASFKAPELPPSTPPAPVSPQLQALVPPPAPVLPRPHPPHPVRSLPAAVFPFVPLAPLSAVARPAIVPPPAPPVARPIPPSGTSPVSQTMAAPQEKREEESATELASSSFAAYDANQRRTPGPWVLVLVLLAAGAGVGARRGGKRGPREQPALALASVRGRKSWR